MGGIEPEDMIEDEDDEVTCYDCGGDSMNGRQCPTCCGNSYAPGTEICDFCPWDSECARYAAAGYQ